MRRIMPLIALFAAIAAPTFAAEKPSPTKFWVFLGTYTAEGKSQGIYRAEFDAETGKLSEPTLAVKATNPTFLAIAPSGKFLYAVGETSGPKGGLVMSYSLGEKSGELKFLSEASSVGNGPCHLTVRPNGKHLFVANYGGGSIAMLPIDDTGAVGEKVAFRQHVAPKVDGGKPISPRGHSVDVDPSGKYLIVDDLGLDQVMTYEIQPENAELLTLRQGYRTKPGAGPRHFAFHPTRPLAFVINETDCTIDALEYTPMTGEFKKLGSYSTLRDEETVKKGYSTAEIAVHPSGRFVYGSNRGHNTIVGFRIEQDGHLALIGHQAKGVKVPRNFAIDPTGKFMLVANQEGNDVVVFAIDQKTGELKETGTSIKLNAPVCVVFQPMK